MEKMRKVYGYEVVEEDGYVKTVYCYKREMGEYVRYMGAIYERCPGQGWEWDRLYGCSLSKLRRGLKSGRLMIQ